MSKETKKEIEKDQDNSIFQPIPIVESIFQPIPLDKKDERRESKRKYEKERRDRISMLIDELKSNIEKEDLSLLSQQELTREEILKRAKQTIINLKTKKQELKLQLEILKQN